MNELQGHGVLLTRPEHQVSSLQQQFSALGAQVVCHPTLTIQPIVVQERIALAQLAEAEWVIFTSQNAVTHLPEILRAILAQQITQGKTLVFAIGESTAACLRQHGLPVTDYPRLEPGSEGLYACLTPRLLKQSVLLIGGETVRPWLADQLNKKGLVVQSLSVYQRILPTPIPAVAWQAWEAQGIDTLVFTSGEGLLNGIQLLSGASSWLAKCLFVVVSERIAELVKKNAVYQDLVVATTAYDAEIVRAVLNYWQA